MILKMISKYFIVCMISISLTKNMEDHFSKASFPVKCYHSLVIIIRCTSVRSLRWSTMIWADLMRALVGLPDNFGSNPG